MLRGARFLLAAASRPRCRALHSYATEAESVRSGLLSSSSSPLRLALASASCRRQFHTGIARSAKSSAQGGDRFAFPDDNDDHDDDDDVVKRAGGVRSRVRVRRGRAVAADFEDDDNFFAKIEAQSERPGGSAAPVQERRPRKPRHELHEEDFEELEGGRRGGGRGGDGEFSSREATTGSRAFGQTPFGKPNANPRRGDSWDEGGEEGRLQEDARGQRGGHVKQSKGRAPHRKTASHYGLSDDTYDNDDDDDDAYLKRATPARVTGGGQARARVDGDYSHRAKDDFAVDYGYKRRDGERGDSGYKRRDRDDYDHRPREGGDYGYKAKDRGDFGYKKKDGGGGGGGGAGDGGYGYRARNSGGSDYGYKAKDDFGVNYGYRGKNGGDRGYDRGRDQRGPPGKARGFSAGAPWEKSGERGPWRRSDPVSGQRSEDAGDGDMLFGIAPVHMALLHGHREFRRLLLNRKRNRERPELQELLRLVAERGIETELVNRRQLDELSEGRPNQGVCLEASRRDFIDYDALFATSADVVSAGAAEVAPASEGEPEPAGGGEESCGRQAEDPVKAEVATDDPATGSPASDTVANGGKRRLWVVINEVNDPMNLGALLRSTYFMGVELVLITKQNSCSLTPTVSKASAGTVEVMDIYTTGRLPQVLQEKAKQGWQIVGTVGYTKSTGSAVPVVPCDQYQLKAPTILLIGNEGYGLPQELLALCDVLLTIEPRRELHRGIESLNLSVATGILLYNLLGKAAEEKQQ